MQILIPTNKAGGIELQRPERRTEDPEERLQPGSCQVAALVHFQHFQGTGSSQWISFFLHFFKILNLQKSNDHTLNPKLLNNLTQR